MKCRNCEKELEQVEGKKARQYCNEKCKKSFYRKKGRPDIKGTPKSGQAITGKPFRPERVECEHMVEGDSGGIACDYDGCVFDTMTPEGLRSEVPKNYGQSDCTCLQCQGQRQNNAFLTLNHGAYKPLGKLGKNEVNRVALPGDVDYVGVAHPATKPEEAK